MTVTRDPNFPAETADLAVALMKCGEGYPVMTVAEAAAQFLIASINYVAQERGYDADQAARLSAHVCENVQAACAENYQRAAAPTDIVVAGGRH